MSVGFFDLLTPALTAVDAWLSGWLSTGVKITLWALFSAAVSMLVFRWLVDPEKADDLKLKIKQAQNELNNHDGEFNELKKLAVKSLALSLKRVRLTVLPAMVSVIPIVFILVFLSSRYDFQQPQEGEQINFQVNWQDPKDFQSYHWSENKTGAKQTELYWPRDHVTVSLILSDGTVVVTLPIPTVPIVHKKQWWNALVANPAGYLDENLSLSSVEFEFKTQQPGTFYGKYFDSWQWPYFILVFLFSILIIVIFRIKF